MSVIRDLDFFIPGVPKEDVEAVYAKLGRLFCLSPAPLDQRVFSVAFESRGEECVATVGERLQITTAKGPQRKKGNATFIPQKTTRSGPLLVAIFSGAPYQIVIDPGTDWHCPISAGSPSSIQFFRAPPPAQSSF